MRMRNAASILCGLALSGCVSTAALPSGNAVGATGLTRVRSNTVQKTYLFVSDVQKNSISLFTDTAVPKLVAKISDGVNLPEQLAFDQAKTLYVVNSNISTVSEYPAGASHPSVTLTTGLEYPSGIAIDAKGDIFVSNNINYATIVEYERGETAPAKTIIGVPNPASLAVDSKGNLYAGAQTSGVYEVPKGSTKPKHLELQDVSDALGVAVGANDDLFVGSCNGSTSGDIRVFHPAQTKSYETITYKGECPYFLGVGAKGDLYVPYLFAGNVAVFKENKKTPYIKLSTGPNQPGAAIGESWPAP